MRNGGNNHLCDGGSNKLSVIVGVGGSNVLWVMVAVMTCW